MEFVQGQRITFSARINLFKTNWKELACDDGSLKDTYKARLSLRYELILFGEGLFVKNGQTGDIWNKTGTSLSSLIKIFHLYLNRGYGVFVVSEKSSSSWIEMVKKVQFSVPGES